MEAAANAVRGLPEEKRERIGEYKLIGKIGEGGFGIVWVAEQLAPVRRQVALKIIKLGMDTREVVARFEQERQALAMMEHPNIAKVFDAGATPDGPAIFRDGTGARKKESARRGEHAERHNPCRARMAMACESLELRARER
jgi:serine/threonine protein kinase